MKTVLVTGIAGFLGSWVAQHLIANGHRVVGVDDLSGGTIDNLPDGISGFFYGDITSKLCIDHWRIRGWEPQAVVHCAAFASENLSHHCRTHAYKSVVLGTANVVNACVNHGVELLVNMSSIAVYGSQLTPFLETTPLLPEDPYGAAKACAETDIRAARDHFGLNYVTFRPHNLIGTRQNMADSTRNVASIFIRQALSGQPLTIFGDGTQTRAWSPVNAVSKVIAACVDRPETWNKSYNIGGEQVMTVNELASTILALTDSIADIQHLPDRNEVKHAISAHSYVKKAFPDLYDRYENPLYVLSEMVEEARKKPFKPLQSLPSIEINKNLPSVWK